MYKNYKPIKSVEQSLLDRILYIGEEIPPSVASDPRPKFVVLGTPQEVIDETNPKRDMEPAKAVPTKENSGE